MHVDAARVHTPRLVSPPQVCLLCVVEEAARLLSRCASSSPIYLAKLETDFPQHTPFPRSSDSLSGYWLTAASKRKLGFSDPYSIPQGVCGRAATSEQRFNYLFSHIRERLRLPGHLGPILYHYCSWQIP